MKIFIQASFLVTLICLATSARRLTPADKWEMLKGRWEVTAYAEQGIQVDKLTPSIPQAQRVWQHISRFRAINFYGLDPDSDEKRPRAFNRWLERDSIQEVGRIAEAIAMPYFAVFFADSTLACYNKDSLTQTIYFPETYSVRLSESTMGLDINYPGSTASRWQAQIVRIEPTRLTLFLPEEAEIVELRKTVFKLP